jgi:hypothetical protein
MTLSVFTFDAAEPGSGLTTLTLKIPGVVMVVWNVIAVDESAWGETGTSFRRICEFPTKPLPLSVNENVPTLTAVGDKDVIEGAGFIQVTAASAKTAEFPDAARTRTMGPGLVSGAVYKPVSEIVPTAAFPPAAPFTDQVIGPGAPPLSAALNCFVAPDRNETAVGEIPTDGLVSALAGSTVTKAIANTNVVRTIVHRHHKGNAFWTARAKVT